MNYTGITDKKLEKSLWFLRNKKKIRFFIYAVVFIIADVFWSIFIINFILLLASSNYGGFEDTYNSALDSISKNYNNFAVYTQSVKPLDLKVLSSGYINTYSSYKTDIYAKVKNDNSKYRISELKYHFSWDTGISETQTTFVEREEIKYLFSLGNEVSGINNLELVVDSVKYDANIGDTGNLSTGIERAKEINIDTSDTSIKATSSIRVLNYVVKNESLYDYDNLVVYPVIFDSNEKPIFIYRNNIGKFIFGEEKEYSINLPLLISGISKVGIFTELDLYEEDNYMR
jgi:hypothetical protein